MRGAWRCAQRSRASARTEIRVRSIASRACTSLVGPTRTESPPTRRATRQRERDAGAAVADVQHDRRIARRAPDERQAGRRRVERAAPELGDRRAGHARGHRPASCCRTASRRGFAHRVDTAEDQAARVQPMIRLIETGDLDRQIAITPRNPIEACARREEAMHRQRTQVRPTSARRVAVRADHDRRRVECSRSRAAAASLRSP